MPHISLTNCARTHGPLISLRLGTQILVVGSSPEAAEEILKTHDRLLSARFLPKSNPYGSSVLDRIAIVWATRCTAIESQVPLREKKVKEMVEILRSREGKVVSIGETMMKLGSTPNTVDFYPIFASLDPQSLRRKTSSCVKEMYAIWGIYIKERRESYVPDGPKKDFLDVFLANGCHNDQINWLALEQEDDKFSLLSPSNACGKRYNENPEVDSYDKDPISLYSVVALTSS
ncbi:unnamed protein product [Dovyalis caffra]|uniref:Uncharacterized protein n=1 Tax=Dovyalis caffra TaxID=77055 RepID=A0AAV1RKI7_9ROSI|nr:unnamed protein product [Dovyalis caffra]